MLKWPVNFHEELKNLTQDLFDWLNSTHNEHNEDKTNFSGTGELLLAPVSISQPEIHEHVLPEHKEINEEVNEAEPAQITALNDAWQGEITNDEFQTNAEIPEDKNENEDENSEHYDEQYIVESQSAFTDYEDENNFSSEISESENENVNENTELHEEQNAFENESENLQEDSQNLYSEAHTSILNQAWHEAANLHINLNEPPPQMWTDINNDDEDEPKDYEETSSLQGDAYIPVPKHGANFTQRLQATLQGRKDRAAKQREHDAENSNHHPYVQKAIIFCGILLMTLGFAYLGLWFIQRETPDNLNNRAKNFYEQGNFDEAVNLYQTGYRRYPHVLTFLTGLARSAEKAGHTQTAIAAWNEYMSSLPKDDTEHRRAAQNELNKLIPGGDNTQQQTHTVTLPQQVKPAQPEVTHKQEKLNLPNVRHMTFDEALAEGNNAFRIGMYSRAIANFHKANAIRENDIRPYIGLAASYRAKGMFFDAKRMLDEARKKFGRDPALEVENYFLRRE